MGGEREELPQRGASGRQKGRQFSYQTEANFEMQTGQKPNENVIDAPCLVMATFLVADSRGVSGPKNGGERKRGGGWGMGDGGTV